MDHGKLRIRAAERNRTLPLTLPLTLLVLLSAALLSGCNTMEGMGEDISSAGSTIEDTAEDASEPD